MKSRRGAPPPGAAQGLFTFCDVTARFSEEEWKLLNDWQKDLYKKVMKEIKQAFSSLGPLIATSVFSLRPKEMEDASFADLVDMEIRGRVSPCPRGAAATHSLKQHLPRGVEVGKKWSVVVRWGPLTAEEIHLTSARGDAKEDSEVLVGGNQCLQDAQDNGNRGSWDGPSAEHADIAEVISFEIKSEMDLYSIDDPDDTRESITSGTSPEVPPACEPVIIKEEVAMYPIEADYPTRGSFTSSTGNGVMNRKKNNGISFRCKDKLSQCKTTPKKFKVNVGQSVYERKSAISQWTGSDQGWIGEQRVQWESGYDQVANPSLHQMSPNAQRTETYTTCVSATRNDSFQCEPSPLQSCISKAHPESEQAFQKNIQHAPQVLRKYPCTACGKSFSVMSNLVIHERIHTGERPYHCTLCGKNFTQKGVLLRHQKMHTGERPYQCNACGKRFNQKHHLLRHQKTHAKAQHNSKTHSLDRYKY
ncbi:zinc finger protein 28-like isoform X2 [Ambystoma mexicanum]|uniref:zinc finger protein 28-like isoform X2 n=1 Tax=Ambystoma mexicanum TaxID=8296 RepID=UPI0037E7FACC